uniref:Uncharacterized protein n=1 Tax=Chromera velia CCMP2878 TaxID=1169474 RepID=A0A0G4HTQ0_9ALVE|eukprot:Cvel_31542.t1-p1 / transcript=Cvel_31542.t1 / gene=Cvel_31542 / organism=Chromera_velia_CCMP2878 / gene_product=hypothetical protein / transcript_product=hypothetical protein / location=Cvel_scaffold4716:4456-6383(+) / protein_length=163 / sequence_SO=supercontig / SO=protein_coding / is_pseudo=false
MEKGSRCQEEEEGTSTGDVAGPQDEGTEDLTVRRYLQLVNATEYTNAKDFLDKVEDTGLEIIGDGEHNPTDPFARLAFAFVGGGRIFAPNFPRPRQKFPNIFLIRPAEAPFSGAVGFRFTLNPFFQRRIAAALASLPVAGDPDWEDEILGFEWTFVVPSLSDP